MSHSLGNVASTAARLGEDVVRRVRSAIDPSAARPAGAGQPASGWLVVTVFGEPDLDPTRLPAPLAEFGERIEVQLQPAAGGKGTELAVRLRDQPSSGSTLGHVSGSDPQGELRSALRRAKQLIEVGEVLVVDPAPHGQRPASPGGALLETWTKAAPKAGVR